MSKTDTKLTSALRDVGMDTPIVVTTGGTSVDSTAGDYISEHDAAIAAAREEGARMVLETMGDVLYHAVSDDGFIKSGFTADEADIIAQGAAAQLDAARYALDTGVIDFTVAPE